VIASALWRGLFESYGTSIQLDVVPTSSSHHQLLVVVPSTLNAKEEVSFETLYRYLAKLGIHKQNIPSVESP